MEAALGFAAKGQGNVLVVGYFVKSRFRSVVDWVPSVDTSTLYSEMLLLDCVSANIFFSVTQTHNNI